MAGNVESTGRTEVGTGFRWGNLRDRVDMEGTAVYWRIKLGRIYRKWDVGLKTGLICLRQGQMAGTCECTEKPSGSANGREILKQLRISWLLKKNSAPRSKYVTKY